jgi:hypothetical protein
MSWPFVEIELHEEPGWVHGHLTPDPNVHRENGDFACACLGGILAEEIHTGKDWLDLAKDVGREDVAMAEAALARLADPPSLFAVVERTRQILRTEWRSVSRVAYALAARRRLSHREFLSVVTRR